MKTYQLAERRGLHLSSCLFQMAQPEVEDLVVHLEESLELSSMEQGVKLVGAVLVNKSLNKWRGDKKYPEIDMERPR